MSAASHHALYYNYILSCSTILLLSFSMDHILGMKILPKAFMMVLYEVPTNSSCVPEHLLHVVHEFWANTTSRQHSDSMATSILCFWNCSLHENMTCN